MMRAGAANAIRELAQQHVTEYRRFTELWNRVAVPNNSMEDPEVMESYEATGRTGRVFLDALRTAGHEAFANLGDFRTVTGIGLLAGFVAALGEEA